MKRFHVHVTVADLEKSTRFYAAMFGAPPSVEKHDYAKWMLDDPRINFAISTRSGTTGLNHLGFQAETDDELQDIHTRLQQADTSIVAEAGADCCYAKSDKYWVQDPSGIAWESFRTLDSIPVYGEDTPAAPKEAASACAVGSGCCPSPLVAPLANAACATRSAAGLVTDKVGKLKESCCG